MTLMRRLSEAVSGLVFGVVVNVIARSPAMHARVRRRLMRLAGARIGASTISSGCFFGSAKVEVGDRSFVNVGAFFDGLAPITIGDDVHIAMQTMILTGSHEIGGPDRRAGHLVGTSVTIGHGAWIGARAVILPGVSVGAGAVIAAGAVVTASCEPDALYAGVPARLIRRLDSTPRSSAAPSRN